MAFITSWNPRSVLAHVSGRVVKGMEAACQFAEKQAKANAPKRTGLLKSDISHEVKASGQEVVGYVGTTKKTFYGLYQERGTRKMAAHPFLRPAIFGNAKEILKLIEGKR